MSEVSRCKECGKVLSDGYVADNIDSSERFCCFHCYRIYNTKPQEVKVIGAKPNILNELYERIKVNVLLGFSFLNRGDV